MISAEEAKEMCRKKNEELLSKLLKQIDYTISYWASSGQNYMIYDITIAPEHAENIKNLLIEKGYKVEIRKFISFEYNIEMTKLNISWE